MVMQAQGADHPAEDLNPKLKLKAKPKPRPTAAVSSGPLQALENLRNVNSEGIRRDTS
jgi:hypothetical protein